MNALRVAIVDDHPMFRMGLAVAIGEMDGIELVGEADAADQVEVLVASTTPDLVLLDVRLGEASGLEVNRWLA
jgi:DNA-binding NarL/FixJ family response regulator